MIEIAAWGNIIGLVFLGACFWKFSRSEGDHREKQDARTRDLLVRLGNLESFRNDSLNSKLEIHRKIKDLDQLVRDKVVEIHNLQDHVSRNDSDVIDLNRTFSKLRPIYKIVLPREQVMPKSKAKTKSRAH